MAYTETTIGALIREGKEKQAAAKLVALLRTHKGNAVHAAQAAGVHHATLKRWVVRLGVRGHLEQIRSRLARVRT